MNDADQPMDEEIQKWTELIDGEADPTKKAKLYFDRGLSYAKKKDDDNAIADFDSAIELNPKNRDEYLYRGLSYLRKEDYDSAIDNFTKAIELNPKNRDEYLYRGLSYLRKEDYDSAIDNFTKAIELKPKNRDEYFYRGRAYFGKEDYDSAIDNFTKAIELKPEDPDAWWWHGRTYLEKGDYDKAIADFTQAIELEPEDPYARWGRGRAYFGKEDYDKAITDFTQAIKLESEDRIAHLWRGISYIRKEDYGNAFEDFLDAGKLDSTIKLTILMAYLAGRIDDIFHQDQDAQHQKSKDQKIEAFELYGELLGAITLIQEALFQPPETSQCEEVAHYTSLHTLKELAGKKSFRFYNVTYMNDPDEGRKFFKIMEDNEANVEEFFYEKNDQPYLSPAYIGSFTMVTPKKLQKDDLFLWRTYGKHDDKEAAGACLLFKHDGSCFAKRFKHQLGPIPQSLLDNESTSESRPQTKPSLYKISYPDDENGKILKHLKKLAKQINLIKDFNKRHKTNEEQLDELARNFLDTIRFLFKSDHYKAEKEVRIVEFHAYKENETQSLDNNIKVDLKQIPPRFYVEAPEDFCFSEVILGPRVRSGREWEQWIEYKQKGPKVKVQQSKIKYGSPYS